jgi:hypothetical protein
LLICVSLDIVEFLFPLLLIPVAGDFIDIIGLSFCLYFFNWIGIIATLELIPGFDSLPIFTISWLVWYILKRKKSKRIESDVLEEWR